MQPALIAGAKDIGPRLLNAQLKTSSAGTAQSLGIMTSAAERKRETQDGTLTLLGPATHLATRLNTHTIQDCAAWMTS